MMPEHRLPASGEATRTRPRRTITWATQNCMLIRMFQI